MIESTSKQTKHNSEPQDSFNRALRAAAAVTGKGRRALTAGAPAVGVVLASMLVGGCADPSEGEEPGAWALAESSVEQRVDAGTDAAADLATDDAGADLSSTPDMAVVASCEDESLAARWGCCVAASFASAGCDVCAHDSLGQPATSSCMSCPQVLEVATDWSNYELCCEQSVRQHVSEPTEQELFGACTPWGPPAPPVMGARKLMELLVA